MQAQQLQVKSVAELDRELEALHRELRAQQVPGAMLELMNDDELYNLAVFVNRFVVVANARGFQSAIELAKTHNSK